MRRAASKRSNAARPRTTSVVRKRLWPTVHTGHVGEGVLQPFSEHVGLRMVHCGSTLAGLAEPKNIPSLLGNKFCPLVRNQFLRGAVKVHVKPNEKLGDFRSPTEWEGFCLGALGDRIRRDDYLTVSLRRLGEWHEQIHSDQLKRGGRLSNQFQQPCGLRWCSLALLAFVARPLVRVDTLRELGPEALFADSCQCPAVAKMSCRRVVGVGFGDFGRRPAGITKCYTPNGCPRSSFCKPRLVGWRSLPGLVRRQGNLHFLLLLDNR